MQKLIKLKNRYYQFLSRYFCLMMLNLSTLTPEAASINCDHSDPNEWLTFLLFKVVIRPRGKQVYNFPLGSFQRCCYRGVMYMRLLVPISYKIILDLRTMSPRRSFTLFCDNYTSDVPSN